MNKFNKSQVLVFFLLLLFLAFTPLLPSSLRPTYLYFISNFIIIALGAEAGLFSVFSKPLEHRMQSCSVIKKPMIPLEAPTTAKLIEESSSVDKAQKGSSKSSPFFIRSSRDDDSEIMDEEIDVEEKIEGLNGQELFAKAEVFIRNFHKQLKMQKDESWIYQKAF